MSKSGLASKKNQAVLVISQAFLEGNKALFDDRKK